MRTDRLDKAMKRVKLWQEQCKLVVLFLSAVGSVWAFVDRLASRHPGVVKAAEDLAMGVPPGARGRAEEMTPMAPIDPLIYNSHRNPAVDLIGVALGALAFVLVTWLAVRAYRHFKRRGATNAG